MRSKDEANRNTQDRLEASRAKPKARDEDRYLHDGYDYHGDRNFGPEDNVTQDDDYWEDRNPDLYA